MTYLPSLPPDAVLLDMFRADPQTARPLPGTLLGAAPDARQGGAHR